MEGLHGARAPGTKERDSRTATSETPPRNRTGRTSEPHPSLAGVAAAEVGVLPGAPSRTRVLPAKPPAAPVLPAPLAPAVRPKRRSLSLGSALQIAVESLLRNPTRSLLATLGIVIGVGSVIAMLGLAQGTRKVVEAEVRKRGTNNLWIRPQEQRVGGVAQGLDAAQKFTLEDADAIARQCTAAIRFAPRVQGNTQVKFGNHNMKTRVIGSTSEFFPIRNMPFDHGRAFRSQELAQRARVCVIGADVAEQLYGRREAVGKTLYVRGQPFLVIGQLVRRGGSDGDWDQTVWVPLSTAMKRLFNQKYLSRMEVEAAEQSRMDEARNQMTEILRKRHRIQDGRDDFEIGSQSDLLENSAATNGALQALLAGIASVSLVVGGIGIMNILLVSVAERTREIGIRRALGAYRRDILSQFLMESLVLCGVGALVGVGAGVAACWAGSTSAGWPVEITADSVLVSSACAIAIGLVAGLYPAMRASGLSPITALRTER